MKRIGLAITMMACLFCATAGEVEETAARIEAWGRDPVIVRAVAAQNAMRATITEIQRIDRAWISGGESERAASLMSNEAAERLRELGADERHFAEAFVMDDQGALVAMTHKTSDYWQGDESKWQEAYEGRGVFIDAPQYDASTNENLVQISVPVRDGERTIGAITVGVRSR